MGGGGGDQKFQNALKYSVFVSASAPKWEKKVFYVYYRFKVFEWSTFVTKLANPPKIQKMSLNGGLEYFQMLPIDFSSGFGSYFDGLMYLQPPKNILGVPTARRRIGHWWFI